MALFDSCEGKQAALVALFAACRSPQEKYHKLIELGRTLAPLPAGIKTPERKVPGCQSAVYLYAVLKEGLVHFQLEADALISAGLAAILLAVYNNEPPEVILKCPPAFLQQLNLEESLSPGRASGLMSIHLRMKQEALQLYANTLKGETKEPSA